MVIDCERCEVRGLACGDCVVGVLLGMQGTALVPRLRLVSTPLRRVSGSGHDGAITRDAG
jgi:hypothetical protein